jgi:hypothetical protein
MKAYVEVDIQNYVINLALRNSIELDIDRVIVYIVKGHSVASSDAVYLNVILCVT